jgi:predicted dehydrogenase
VIASRDPTRAQAPAQAFGIPRAHGCYAELLPNHLHVPLSIEAAAAGKHVLCEKPIALTAEEAERLVAGRDQAGVLIQER